MQQRHKDRRLYFKELANTSREFYIDYVEKWSPLGTNTKVLEIGCGEGGNLLPFAEKGCQVMGIDISQSQIKKASQFFKENNQTGKFIASDFLLVPKPESEEDMFDIILVHDVIEHIEAPHKMSFLQHMKHFMHHDAIAFFAFPAWQMPFGGHQQICLHAMSKIPYIHLLPTRAYLFLLSKTGEPESTIEELTSIKRSRMTIEGFEKTVKKNRDACRTPHPLDHKSTLSSKVWTETITRDSSIYINQAFAQLLYYISMVHLEKTSASPTTGKTAGRLTTIQSLVPLYRIMEALTPGR